DLLKKHNIFAIPMEEIKNSFGDRKIEALHETGYLGMKKGLELWVAAQKHKNPLKCVVKVMGYGPVAWGAIRFAARNFISVTILNKKDFYKMKKHIPGTDILVNCVNWPFERRGKELIITKEQVKKCMRHGSVIVDLVVNPLGHSPIETCRPTYLDNNQYQEEGVWHTCCWGWPNYNPKKASELYSKLIVPHIIEIIAKGPLNVGENIRRAYVNIEALIELPLS
ncbi:unnamed protein product, partial [marine sediment metagenome]